MKIILKIIGKAIGLLFKAILILLVVAIVLPVGWFAWRAGQPMELPQFNGLSYYQYLSWQKMALHQMAVDYHAAYPNKKMGGGLDMCFHVNLGVDLIGGVPIAGLETLAGVFPNIKKIIDPRDWDNIPQAVTPPTFLPLWWGIFEKLVWSGAEYAPHTFTTYCRLQPNVPTPEQLQAMQQQASVQANSPAKP